MRIMGVIFGILFVLMAGCLDVAVAAKRKNPPTVTTEKPIYEAPMRVVIVRNSSPQCEPICPEWIAAEGEITDATPAVFRQVLRAMGKNKLPVVIRSPGGAINAALIIGKLLRDRDMTVAVGSTVFSSCSPASKSCTLPPESKGVYDGYIVEDQAFCNSACPMVLSGGTTRLTSYATSIGLHEPKTVWTRQQTRYRDYYRIVNGRKKITKHQILSRKMVYDKTTYGLDKALRKRLASFYGSMGIDLAILDESTRAHFNDLYFLPEDMKTKLHLRTSGQLASYLSNPKLCGTTSTSAICVEDKARDPAKLAMRRLMDVGVKPDAAKMTFSTARLLGVNCVTVCPVWVSAEGVIKPETPAEFKAFVKVRGLQKLAVVFHSSGGDPLAAIELGRLIRESGFETALGRTVFDTPVADVHKPEPARINPNGVCNGACALAFAGGTQRHANGEMQVQLQNPTLYGVSQTSSLSVAMNQHFLQMGVKPGLMAGMHMLRGKESRQMSRADMLDTALATDAQNVVDLLSPVKCLTDIWATSCLSPLN